MSDADVIFRIAPVLEFPRVELHCETVFNSNGWHAEVEATLRSHNHRTSFLPS